MNNIDVKKIRTLIGLSQTKFGDLLNVTRGTVAKWESKETKPNQENALLILSIENRFNNGEKDVAFNILNNKANNKPEGKIIEPGSLHLKQVTIMPIKGRGGLENAYYDKVYINGLEKETMQLKKESSEGSEWFKIEVEGISMDDSTSDYEGSKYSLVEGDWAYCRSISKQYWRDKLHFSSVRVFCFFHNTRGIIFKKVKSHNTENGELLLTSLNSNKELFPDFKINVAECSYILNILKVVTEF